VRYCFNDRAALRGGPPSLKHFEKLLDWTRGLVSLHRTGMGHLPPSPLNGIPPAIARCLPMPNKLAVS